jgi:hypothetical protein
MKVFRYNTRNRKDRKFNTCGKEKNPNNVKFYASNMAYAERYKIITTECGEYLYECELETTVIVDKNLFNMNANFESLTTYKMYVDSIVSVMRRDFSKMLKNAKTKSEVKLFQGFINNLVNEEASIKNSLINGEFQSLSDFENQNELIAELAALGFEGYITKNEIAIF